MARKPRTCHKRLLEAFGQTKTISEWVSDRHCVVEKTTFVSRVDNGWDIERALTTPKTTNNAMLTKPEFWKDEELQFIRDNFVTMKNREMAEILGRSTVSVKQKRAQLKLNKPKIKPGDKFDRLTVVAGPFLMKYNNQQESMVLCRCSCDEKTESLVRVALLKKGHSRSCGCLFRERALEAATKHGCQKENPRLYNVFTGMIHRCYDIKCDSYVDYGGRGISVTDEWNPNVCGMDVAIRNFFNWVATAGYEDGLTIDRIDNNGNYEPSNCRWVDMTTQANNRRSNHLLEIFGETKTIAQWSQDPRCVIKHQTLATRLRKRNDWTSEMLEVVITTPGNVNLRVGKL